MCTQMGPHSLMTARIYKQAKNAMQSGDRQDP